MKEQLFLFYILGPQQKLLDRRVQYKQSPKKNSSMISVNWTITILTLITFRAKVQEFACSPGQMKSILSIVPLRAITKQASDLYAFGLARENKLFNDQIYTNGMHQQKGERSIMQLQIAYTRSFISYFSWDCNLMDTAT